MPAYFSGRFGRLGILSIAAFILLCVLAGAQEPAHPKWEVFGGYSATDTGAAIHGILPGGVAPSTACLCWDTRGFGSTLTYNFLPWFGVTGDVGAAWTSHESDPFKRFDHASLYNISAGPKFTYHIHHVSTFAEILAGGHRLTPELFHPNDVFGFMAGGGVDFGITRHFAFRLIHADYVFSNHQFGPSSIVPSTGVRGARLQSGVVFMFGGGGGAIIAQPHIQSPLPLPHARAAMPVIQSPSVTCSAMPMSVLPGESSLITANGISPQNRPLTYNFNATAGSIVGTNSTAILSTAGAASGIITVTCVVADDKGQTAAQTTQVTVAAAVVAAKAATSDLCSISFQRDLRRPSRVNNEAKACLDEIALGLQRSPDTTLAIIGNTKVRRSGRNTMAAQRAVNTKAYLVKEKGIDASRIKVYTGIDKANTVSNISVPLGATLSNEDHTLVDEKIVKPSHPRHLRRRTRSTAARHKAGREWTQNGVKTSKQLNVSATNWWPVAERSLLRMRRVGLSLLRLDRCGIGGVGLDVAAYLACPVVNRSGDTACDGTLSLCAALETATGRVHRKTTTRHTSQDFVGFLEEVVALCPAGRFTSSSTTYRLTRPAWSKSFSNRTAGCTSTSRRPTPRGSIRSSCGSERSSET